MSNMQKKDNSNTHPLVKFMNKRITVRMLEAHFNALPELLRYVIEQAKTDLAARMALHNFEVEAKKERPCLDPVEAVYGFAANIVKIGSEDCDDDELLKDAEVIANLVGPFCEINELGKPEDGWVQRLKMVKIK